MADQENAFAGPFQQLAFPAATIGQASGQGPNVLASLQKAQQLKQLAAFLNRPGSQMSPFAQNAGGIAPE